MSYRARGGQPVLEPQELLEMTHGDDRGALEVPLQPVRVRRGLLQQRMQHRYNKVKSIVVENTIHLGGRFTFDSR